MSDLQILARTMYGEARGEYTNLKGGLGSLIAVANVVVNRFKQQTWYGETVQEVCQKPWQFSCWNQKDPNFRVISSSSIKEDPLFKLCLYVSEKIMKEEWPDLTGGCDHYYATTLKTPPRWAIGRPPKLHLGHHLFYDLKGSI